MEKPYDSYNGGKESDGTYQKIINLMPAHDIYIEAFLGNGAIFRHKKPALLASIGIDLDTAVIKQWKNKFIPGITLINCDAISWLNAFSTMAPILNKIGVVPLIYLDPPYPKESRKSQRDLYKHEYSRQDHIQLLKVAGSLKTNVVISSYPNELYEEALKDWSNIEFQSQTRSGTATEKVWYNYPKPTELHDYSYIGDDYRERDRIKGIVCRNVSKFKRLPAEHRNAIIEQLKQQNIL